MERVKQEGPTLDRLQVCWPSLLRLLLVAAVMSVVLAWFGESRYGQIGIVAALVAVLICFVPAAVALLVTSYTTGTPNAVSGLFLGTFLRTAIPIAASFFLVQTVAPLAAAGLFGMVLITYLVVLSVETCLAVRIVQTVQSTTTVIR